MSPLLGPKLPFLSVAFKSASRARADIAFGAAEGTPPEVLVLERRSQQPRGNRLAEKGGRTRVINSLVLSYGNKPEQFQRSRPDYESGVRAD